MATAADVALCDNQEKEKSFLLFVKKRSQDDCLTSRCTDSKSKNDSCPQNEKSLVLVFHPFYSANLEKWTEMFRNMRC